MANYHDDEGYLEAVLFLFFQDGKILIEHRPKRNTKETFIPNGKIETKDFHGDSDYKINAMKREVYEEFSGQVEVTNYRSIGVFDVDELKIRFFGYLITAWSGKVPEYTVEEGKKHADLEWVPIGKYKDYLKFPSSIFFVEKAIEALGARRALAVLKR